MWRCDGWICLLPASWLRVRVLPLLIITTNLHCITSCQSSPHVKHTHTHTHTHSLSLSLSCAHSCKQAAQQCVINVEFLLALLPWGGDRHRISSSQKHFGFMVMNRCRRRVDFVMLSGKAEYYRNRKQELYLCYRSQSRAIRAFINP